MAAHLAAPHQEWPKQLSSIQKDFSRFKELSLRTQELVGGDALEKFPSVYDDKPDRRVVKSCSSDQAKQLVLEYLLAEDVQPPLEVQVFGDAIISNIKKELRESSQKWILSLRHLTHLVEDLGETYPSALRLEKVELATDKRLVITEINARAVFQVYYDLTGSLHLPQRHLFSSNLSTLAKRQRTLLSTAPNGTDLIETKLSRSAETTDDEELYSPAAIQALLAEPSAAERRETSFGTEVMGVLHATSAQHRLTREKLSTALPAIRPYCHFFFREICNQKNAKHATCTALHWKKIIRPGITDESLGDCSYLDTCRHHKTCRQMHYEIDPADLTLELPPPASLPPPSRPAEWINCDIRTFPFEILGTFDVIMADPPWDIHMELPYGTMSDDEMRSMNVQVLQKDGYIFLWVTGRAMELGRECLTLWGYDFVQELIWAKTNQLQKLVRTGRTGHWLNHSKEHCLVGVKGKPQCNMFLDGDVLVSEVRETSRKPDEIYMVLERLSPGTRKIELFGRKHNLHLGWMTLGNQLDGVHIVDPVMNTTVTNYLNSKKT